MSLRIFAKKILTLSFWIPAAKACILCQATKRNAFIFIQKGSLLWTQQKTGWCVTFPISAQPSCFAAFSAWLQRHFPPNIWMRRAICMKTSSCCPSALRFCLPQSCCSLGQGFISWKADSPDKHKTPLRMYSHTKRGSFFPYFLFLASRR